MLMNTPRAHFEELDWLEYAQGRLDREEKLLLDDHLETCSSCRDRLKEFERMVTALDPLWDFIRPEGDRPAAEDQALMERAEKIADTIDREVTQARAELVALGPALPAPESFVNLSHVYVYAAILIARESFATRFEESRNLITWAVAALERLQEDDSKKLPWPGLAGAVGSCMAYLRHREGKPLQALSELDAARTLLDLPVPLRDLEMAFWSYVRAGCLHNLSRFEEALREISSAEEIYAAFGESRRAARSRFLRAIILSDSGNLREALPLYESLVQDKDAMADAPIYALLYLSFASCLVFSGDLKRAKSAYAKTAGLLKKTGQEDQLFRVRVGLADIAHREGRLEDALDLNVRLRSEFRERRLPWDEVRRELWIIREFLELERFEEARETCRALASRAEELSLTAEARSALAYLADAEEALSAEAIASVQEVLQRIERGISTRWSVA